MVGNVECECHKFEFTTFSHLLFGRHDGDRAIQLSSLTPDMPGTAIITIIVSYIFNYSS